MGFLGYPKGSALELLDGTLKLRYCTTLFTKRFPPWSLPQVVLGLVKGVLVLSVISWILIVLLVKGSGLPRRRVQTFLLMSFRTQFQGTQRRGDGKDCFPLPPKERGERWACLAIFFLALGLGDFALGNAWNLLSEATGVGGSGWTVQPKRLAQWC